ncbi:hypothetical protein KP509_11G042800 [Ceratopteris richardii]|nr:hypothetical protein KP509_11G042800 [Ceratopteris richardii]
MVVKPQLQSSCTTERRRPHNSTRDNSLTSHTSLGAYRKHTEKSIMHRGEVETCSCSIPLRYIAKYLRTEKGKSTPRKESASQPNSPAKFSTLTNRLFSPQLSPRARLPVNVSTKTQRSVNVTALQGRIVGQDESMVKVVNGLTSSKVGDMDHKEGEEVKHSVECESFGSAMVNDYVQHIQEKPKSLAVRKCCSFASFEYDSDFKISGVSKAHSNRLDPGNRPFQLCSSLSRNISGVTEKLVAAANAVVNQPRSSSMDSLVRLDSESSTCSSKVGDNDLDMDYGSSAELLAVEERNERKLALLKLKIKHLNEEKKLLGRDLAAEMEARHRAQESAKVIVRNMEREMEGKLISAEKNHAYAKACLEQEIDRRKKDWAAKLEKIKVEEKRLRDRVTEMAIERVELQKAIAMYRDREASLQAQARDHELSAQTWMRRHHQSEEEVSRLRKSATNGSSKLGSKENGMEWVWQRSKVLERENAELMKEVSRLRKAYANEELSFENLWQNLIDIMNGPSNSKLQSLRRLYRELKAFAVREEDLRHEIDILQSQLLKIKHKITPEHEMGGRVFSPVGHLRSLASTDKGSELTEQLINKLELTKQHTRHVEHQLEAKEEEVELLHSTLQEREDTINNMQAELTSVKVQRDGLQKQVQLMSQEANRLTQELSELKQVVEKLDDELMLKEGEISILRDNCSESDF